MSNMKVQISSRQLEILRKAVYGLTNREIASEMSIPASEVDTCIKDLLKTTRSKEPMQAMQALAKNGFQLAD